MPKINDRPGDLPTIIKRLEQRIRALEAAPRASLTSVRGGHVTFLRDDGTVIVKIGELEGGSVGLLVQRQDGSPGLTVYNGRTAANPDPNAPEFIAIWDNAENIVVSDDANAGFGLARPWLNYPAFPDFPNGAVTVVSGGWAQITSTAFTNTWQINTPLQHPWHHIDFLVQCDAGTSAEVMLYDETDSVQIGATQTVAAGGYAALFFDERYTPDKTHLGNSSVDFGQPHSLRIRARVSGGTGAVRVAVTAAYGCQT
jgi:hypothetical protein